MLLFKIVIKVNW